MATHESTEELVEEIAGPQSRSQHASLRSVLSNVPELVDERESNRTADPSVGRWSFEAVFAEAMEGGGPEGYLMEQSSFLRRWKAFYFKLEDGFLARFEKESHVGSGKKKTMELTGRSKTSFSDTQNCFAVTTDQETWFLLAKDYEDMKRWMMALHAQIYYLFLRSFTPPGDNYWGQGVKGRFVHRVKESASPQWVYTHPEEGAPRAGEGVYPSKVLEVVQRLTGGDGHLWLRLPDGRGWVHDWDPQDGEPCLEEVAGEFVEDNRTYELPRNLQEPWLVLCGPSMTSEPTGDELFPGERVEAAERFTPAPSGGDDDGVVFVKMADGRGWCPIRMGASGA